LENGVDDCAASAGFPNTFSVLDLLPVGSLEHGSVAAANIGERLDPLSVYDRTKPGFTACAPGSIDDLVCTPGYFPTRRSRYAQRSSTLKADIPNPTFREQAIPPISRQLWIMRGPRSTDERTSRDVITRPEKRHNRKPSLYSITSSAAKSSPGGILMHRHQPNSLFAITRWSSAAPSADAALYQSRPSAPSRVRAIAGT
jgi:hypothetical protein